LSPQTALQEKPSSYCVKIQPHVLGSTVTAVHQCKQNGCARIFCSVSWM